jgi:rhodanese-related sulfurtransferase
MPIRSINPVTFKQILDDGESVVVLDVREYFERDLAKITLPATATELAIPMNSIPLRLHEIQAVSDRPIFVYCHHGVRSLSACRWLSEQGIPDLINLSGGIDSWTDHADPSTPRY